MELRDDDPVAVAVVDAIHKGDLGTLGSLLAEHRELAGARIGDPKAGTRSLLHVVTDWPGYFPVVLRLSAFSSTLAQTPTPR